MFDNGSNLILCKGSQEEEIELDIDELSDEVLYKLLTFVKRHAPRAEDKAAPNPTVAPASSRPKKNKPMGKAEQEAQIKELRGKLNGLQEAVGGAVSSPGDCKYSSANIEMQCLIQLSASQAVANEDDTSGDDDSEESEED